MLKKGESLESTHPVPKDVTTTSFIIQVLSWVLQLRRQKLKTMFLVSLTERRLLVKQLKNKQYRQFFGLATVSDIYTFHKKNT